MQPQETCPQADQNKNPKNDAPLKKIQNPLTAVIQPKSFEALNLSVKDSAHWTTKWLKTSC